MTSGSSDPIVPLLARGVLLLSLASLAVAWFRPIDSVGIGDWDQFFSYAWLGVQGLLERGAPPLWTVQLAGGAPLAGDPQALTHTPLLALPLLFGPIVGVKLATLASVALGLAGAERLGRRWIGDALGASVFAFVLVFSGYFAVHLRAGHFPWTAFFLVPWILFHADRILFDESVRARDALAFLSFLSLLFAGPVYHALVYFLAPLAVAYAVSRPKRPERERMRLVASLVLSAFAVTAPRWLAIVDWQIASPRTVYFRGGMPLSALARMLVVPIEDRPARVPWGGSDVLEYWSYVGVVAAGLALVSLRRASAARSFALACLVLSVLLVWRTPWGNPFAWAAAHLPFADSVRVFSRFSGLAVFAIALCAGAEVARLRCGERTRALALVLAAVIAADYAMVTGPIWARVFSLPPADVYPDWGASPAGMAYREVRAAPFYELATASGEKVNSRMLPLLMTGAVVENAYVTPRLPSRRPSLGPTVEAPAGTTYRITNHALDFSGRFAEGDTILVRLGYAKNVWKSADRASARIQQDRQGMRIVMLRDCEQVSIRLRESGEAIAWLVAAAGLVASGWVIRRVRTERA